MDVKEYVVYWIKSKSHTDIYRQGYIGVTNDLERRWRRHKKHVKDSGRKVSGRPLYRAFRKFGLDGFEFVVVDSGLDKMTAYNLEYCLRPYKRIGYNCEAGGGFYASPLLCSTLSPLSYGGIGRSKISNKIDESIGYYSSIDQCGHEMYEVIKRVLCVCRSL